MRLDARDRESGEGAGGGIEGVHLGAGDGLSEVEAVSKKDEVRGLPLLLSIIIEGKAGESMVKVEEQVVMEELFVVVQSSSQEHHVVWAAILDL